MNNLKIIPLGGVRENARNMYVIEIDDTIFILDCGLAYPEDQLYGIDAVIPDFTYLEKNADKIAGVFLTHGHEDAIGALPYFLDKFDVPVFGSELTISLAKWYVEEAGLDVQFDNYHAIDEEVEIDFDGTVIRFFRTTHTIPDSMGIAVHTDKGNIVYTGNFKFDQTAVGDYKTDYGQISEIGREGVLALLSDSMDAESLSENVLESDIQEEVFKTFQETKGRIIVVAVASNILRIQQVLNAASRFGRKVFISGRHIESVMQIALDLEKLTLPEEDLFIPIDKIKDYEDEEIVILETGGAGEPIQTLDEMARGLHNQVAIKKGDLVYIVTSPSSTMEVTVAKTENQVYRAGGTVKTISDNLKASGHATPNDLQWMINLLNPTYFIPIQGEYRMLAAHADLAHQTGIPYRNIFIVSNGDVLEYTEGTMRQTGQVPAENTFIDGIGIGDVGNIVLRDRRILADDGIFVSVCTINRRQKTITSGPYTVTRGFVFAKESQELIDEGNKIVAKVVKDTIQDKSFSWSTLKSNVRDELGSYLFKETKRRPIILPVIMEVK
ncbi:ribonuclease J [Atopostipes suicloacalis DSM 15692]|uniref:Ribonuclease J n=1 Tax=Atopostipes suicloacalis DSM 15692 TaxID=1121025 RepID=A0A1M4VW81_9LACT|nr:ribonuclease J [Atopostipes suicloacalis]SHE73165.1 ribonuclease J [Atopostipes suicloacalis DSM 15692]